MITINGRQCLLVPDTSQYQGLLDFPTLQQQWYYNYFFGEEKIIILKATEGNGFVDPFYVTNAKDATANGWNHVAYHYARPDGNYADAVKEAQFVSGVARGANAKCIMLDFEEGSMRSYELAQWRHDFLTELFREWNAPHGLYEGAYLLGTDRLAIPVDPNLPKVWLCVPNYPKGYTSDPNPLQFNYWPPTPPGFAFDHLALWQYTSSAHVKGIGGSSVDMSIASADWAKLVVSANPQGDEFDMADLNDLTNVVTEAVKPINERVDALYKLVHNDSFNGRSTWPLRVNGDGDWLLLVVGGKIVRTKIPDRATYDALINSGFFGPRPSDLDPDLYNTPGDGINLTGAAADAFLKFQVVDWSVVAF